MQRQAFRPDPLRRLLSTAPEDLRWAAQALQERDVGSASILSGLADRIDAAMEVGEQASYRLLLAEASPALRGAAAVLRASDVTPQRHRANNLLQSAENADYLLLHT